MVTTKNWLGGSRREAFPGVRNDLGSGYMNVHIYKIYQAVQLIMLFTIYISFKKIPVSIKLNQ